MITIKSKIKAIEDHVSCDMAEEAVVLNVKNGVYYGLDEIGARIWKLALSGTTIENIVDVITSEYDVGKDQCTTDLIEFFKKMEVYGLIEVS